MTHRVLALMSWALIAAACRETTGLADPQLRGPDPLSRQAADSAPRPGGPPAPGTQPDTGSQGGIPDGFIGAVWGYQFTSAPGDSLLVRLGGATVRIYRQSSAEVVTQQVTAADGVFSFPQLPDGVLRIRAFAPSGAPYRDSGYEFEVRGGRLSQFTYLNVVLPPR